MLSYNPYLARKSALVDIEITLQMIYEEVGIDYQSANSLSEMMELGHSSSCFDASLLDTLEHVVFRLQKCGLYSESSGQAFEDFTAAIHLTYRFINLCVRDYLPNAKPGKFPWF